MDTLSLEVSAALSSYSSTVISSYSSTVRRVSSGLDCRIAYTLQEVVDDPGGNKMLLVMDYMEGGPVLTREGLERGRRVPEPLARQYFRDMCKVCAERALSWSFGTVHAFIGTCFLSWAQLLATWSLQGDQPSRPPPLTTCVGGIVMRRDGPLCVRQMSWLAGAILPCCTSMWRCACTTHVGRGACSATGPFCCSDGWRLVSAVHHLLCRLMSALVERRGDNVPNYLMPLQNLRWQPLVRSAGVRLSSL